jgi:flagellin
VRAAFVDGDLMINGVQIGASYADDDNLSSANQATSVIAKVAAINRLSDSTGVVAKAAQTVVSGAVMTGAASSAAFTINGYSTADIGLTTDTALSRKLVTDAINAISKATGVTAFDTQSDNGGVVLTAADGRNITVATSFTSTANHGVAAAATYVGSYHLYSKDGSDIVIESKEDVVTTGTTGASAGINKAGLRTGTYAGGVASTSTHMRGMTELADTSDGQTVADVAGVLNGDTLVINGIAIGAAIATDDTASFQSSGTSLGSQRSASAIAIAAAINKQTDRTGVKATAEANVIRGTSFTAGSSATVILNGVTISGMDTSDINDVVDSFNEYSGQTGVVARIYGTALELRAEDGRNIAIASTSAGAIKNLGLGDVLGSGVGGSAASVATFYSTVRLESDEAFTVESGAEGVLNFERLGFRRGTFGGAIGDKISEVNITTQQGASDALRSIDAAINQVSAAQALSGALNNRLDVIVNNLSEGLQNMSASRSRILDTDYATETTELAKQQIIQQAATAMLAQANQQPQGVLALLR